VEANSTGGQGSRRAVAPSDDDNENTVVRVCSVIRGHSLIVGGSAT
jgi:hypothetical protein